MPQLLALTAAALYGVADFAGGVATRSLSAWRVTAWSQLIGLPILALGLFALGPADVSSLDLVLGAVGGVFGFLGLVLLYSALATGSMSVVAPLIGVLTAAVPVAWDVATGGTIAAIHWIGITVAIAAVVVLTVQPAGTSIEATTVVKAISAALAFAVFIIAFSQTSESSGLWPLIPARILTVPLGFSVAALTSTAAIPPDPQIRWVGFVGIADLAASIALVLSVQRGPLGIIAAISSLYPAFTILAAFLFLKERPSVPQRLGIVMALLAAAMLTI